MDYGISVTLAAGEIEVASFSGGIWLELDQSRPGAMWHGDYCTLSPQQAREVATALMRAAEVYETAGTEPIPFRPAEIRVYAMPAKPAPAAPGFVANV
jgi:hypothetical protein